MKLQTSKFNIFGLKPQEFYSNVKKFNQQSPMPRWEYFANNQTPLSNLTNLLCMDGILSRLLNFSNCSSFCVQKSIQDFSDNHFSIKNMFQQEFWYAPTEAYRMKFFYKTFFHYETFYSEDFIFLVASSKRIEIQAKSKLTLHPKS